MDARTHTLILLTLVGVLLVSPKLWAQPGQRWEQERGQRPERTERQERPARPESPGRADNAQHHERAERERVQRQERTDRSQRQELHERSERQERRERQEGGVRDDARGDRDARSLPGRPPAGRPQSYFHEEHREVIRNYYGRTYAGAYRCPPGLLKKHNGCLPPGHARAWRLGYVLPPSVIYYDVEPDVLVRLGPPPSGHRFVRVAGDILLIAIGTGLVIDAIEDLGR